MASGLKQLRMSKKRQDGKPLSLLNVYDATGIDPGTLSKYENGITIPRYEASVKLGEFYDKSPGEIQRLAYEARQARSAAAQSKGGAIDTATKVKTSHRRPIRRYRLRRQGG